MQSGFLKVPWLIWGIVATAIAIVFAVFVPSENKVNAASGVQYIILRWFHSLCWVLLAANFFLRHHNDERSNKAANMLATSGGITYATYLVNYISAIGS